jgi:transposase
VWWDRNGFWLAQKRLEKDKFPWPETNEYSARLVQAFRFMLCMSSGKIVRNVRYSCA